MNEDLLIQWNGERCVTLKVTNQIEYDALAVIQKMMIELEAQQWLWVEECVPGYTGLTLYVDPLDFNPTDFNQWVSSFKVTQEASVATEFEDIEIPVLYGGTYGPDLDRVAQHSELTPEQVIEKHTHSNCLIYMMGFLPGFAYMGGMDPDIATPRLSEPRTVIEAGSVGIAGEQTGIYPLNSPGGWNIIGRTPLCLFDPEREEPALLKAGMRIRFKAIDEVTYNALLKESVRDRIRREG